MRFKSDFNEFKDSITAIGKAVKKDRAMEPDLQLVKLTADKKAETLKLETNGNNIGVEVVIPSKVEEDGEFLASFAGVNIITLRDCDGDIVGTGDERNLVLKYKDGKAKTSLPMSTVPFTSVPSPATETPRILLPGDKLREMFNGVSFVADEATSSTALHAVKLDVADDEDEEGLVKVEMSSCDGKSIGQIQTFCVKKGSFTGSAIIPPERIKLMLDIFKGKDGDVELSVENYRMFASLDNIRICFAVLDSSYPDLKKLLAKRSATTFRATFDKKDFIEAMKCVLYLKPEGSAMLNFSGKTLSVGCLGFTEYGETIEAETEGTINPVLFNAKMLKDIATALPGETLKISGTGNKAPFFITYGANDEYIYCALPRTA